MTAEKYNPKKEIEKLCEEHKIFFTKGKEDYEDLIDIGLGSILHNQLNRFIERKETNGFHFLKVINPKNREEIWKIKIKYNGGEDPLDRKKSNFVLDSNRLPQRIDHAVGKIKIDGAYLRYYGVKLDEEIEKQGRHGEMITLVKKVPALILENGEIISENTKPEGVNFEFDSIITLKNNRWGLKSIKDFTKGKIKKEDYTFEIVFNEFKKKYDKSMVLDNDGWYSLLTLRDIKSYFWDLNDKFIIIKHEGISGTAKSKGMKIGANLSFNGKKFLCPTPANFFRYRHHNKATISIEEAERLFDQSKKQSVGDSELVEYLNGSYEKGNTVPRQNDKNINQTDEFDPAGDTAIGSINPLKGALEKRSITLNMIKASKNDPRGNVEIPSETDKEYCDARNKAYICGLLNYRDYEKALNKVENNYGLANREWLISKPLIALASCISEELEKQIGDFISSRFIIRDDFFDESSWERIMARVLIEIFCIRKDSFFISTNQIKDKFIQRIEGDYKVSPHKITKIINKLGFLDYNTRDTTGSQRGYEISFTKLCEILIRNDWIGKENILKIVSEVSDCQFTEDKISKWYTDTFLTLDTFNKKNKEVPDTSDTLALYSEGVGNNLNNFSDEEIKKAGYSREQLKEILEDNPFLQENSEIPIIKIPKYSDFKTALEIWGEQSK